jgi:hypothetical protein
MKNRRPTLRESVSIAPDAMPAADPFGPKTSPSKPAVDIVRSGVLVRVTPDLRRELKLTAFHDGAATAARSHRDRAQPPRRQLRAEGGRQPRPTR